MSLYYTLIMTLAVLSMLAMFVCVSSSGTMNRIRKRYFRLLFISVSIAAFCEWFAICLQGTGSGTRVLHILVKAVELSVAPSICFLMAGVIENRCRRFILIFLGTNSLLEFLSGIFGFIYSVDINSNYTHSAFYWIYIVVYVFSISYGISVILRNIKKYQYGGIVFFGMIVFFILFGIIAQLLNSDMKVDYITIAVAAIMLYVFTLEMIQQTDELTGLINRRGYENHLSCIDDKCLILMFDVDKFKDVNDKYGHQFGDHCLRQIGDSIRANYSKYGKCFRIGGDEFCVIQTKDTDQIETINKSFFNMMEKDRELEKQMPYVSIGYVLFDPQVNNIQDALAAADKMMYKFKNEHKKMYDNSQI
jgi:diguanylate cyclase (GGDEF)-like protein